MSKILSLIFIISCSLFAKEPFLAILYNVDANSVQKFNIGKYNFYCKTYGIAPLEDLYATSKDDSVCKKEILKFYKKNPRLQYFSQNLLKVKQRYHLEIIEDKCILYAQGETSLSELLLKNGLALLKPRFKNEEFSYAFKNAQIKAKILKKGLWSEKVFLNCQDELNRY